MSDRTTRSQVVFANPFTLKGFAQPHPAGIFDLDRDEDRVEAGGHVGFRHVASYLHLTIGTTSRMVSVDPDDLTRALAHDRAIG